MPWTETGAGRITRSPAGTRVVSLRHARFRTDAGAGIQVSPGLRLTAAWPRLEIWLWLAVAGLFLFSANLLANGNTGPQAGVSAVAAAAPIAVSRPDPNERCIKHVIGLYNRNGDGSLRDRLLIRCQNLPAGGAAQPVAAGSSLSCPFASALPVALNATLVPLCRSVAGRP